MAEEEQYNRYDVKETTTKNVQDNVNPRSTAATVPFAVLIYLIIGIPLMIVSIIGVILANGVIFTSLVGSYTVFETIHYEWEIHAVQAIKTGNVQKEQAWINFINPFEEGYNAIITMAQYGVSVWDYTYPFLVNLMQLFFDIIVPLMKEILAFLWPYLMEFLLWFVQIAQIFMQVLVQVMQSLAGKTGGTKYQTQAIETSGGGSAGPVGSPTGAVPGGETVGGLPLNFINTNRPVTVLFVDIFQEVAYALSVIINSWGLGIVDFIDFFLNIVIKYLPIIMQGFSFIADILNPDNPIGHLLFTCFDFVFGLSSLISGQCELQIAFLKAQCVINSIIHAVISGINNVLHTHLGNVPNCNLNSIGNSCQSAPANTFAQFSGSGAGICDATVCAQEVVAIISLLQQQRPTCQQWVANANSTLACLAVVYNFSVTQSQYTGNTPIDAIGQEVCFVITVLVSEQCAQSLPPFSFSIDDAANSICVADRSGLSPPAPPFNDQCACVYTAPLCNGPCCNQYARHVNGQILYYVGQYTCGQLTSQFPPTFWCQYFTTNAQNITASSDYTFSSTWCQAYLTIIQPACASATPLQTLASIDTAALVDQLSATACNQTVNQVGVCMRINTTTAADFIDFQYSLGETSIDDLYSSLLPYGTPLTTIPTSSTPIDEITTLDIQKYYCYAFFQYYNSTNPVIQSRPGSPLYIVFSYCQTSIGAEFGTFNLENYTYFKLITPSGNAQPITLTSIPPDVQPFQNTFGGGVPVPPTIVPTCLDGMTGYNPQELSYQSQCTGQQQVVVNSAGDTAGGTAQPAFDALSQSQVNTAQIVHLGGMSAINTSSPNATTQTIEYEQTATATQLPTTWQIQTGDDITPTTSNFRTNYPTPPEGTQTAFYVQYRNTPAGRNLLGVETEPATDPPNKPANEATKNIISKLLIEGLQSITDELSKLKTYGKTPGSATPFIAKLSARRGKARLQRAISIIQGEMKNRTANFAASRKLMATGNSDIDQYVENFWDTVANTDVSNSGISDENLEHFLTDQAFKDIRVFSSNAMNVWAVNVFNLFYNENITAQDLDRYGLDYAYYGGAGGTPPGTGERCKNTFQEPLKCCKANTSPYGCCYGLGFLCIPMVADYFYAPITNQDNIDYWLCTNFDTFFKAWQSTIRTIITPILSVALELTETSFPHWAQVLLRPVTWPNFAVPPFSIQCMFVNGRYIVGGIFIFWMLSLFFAYNFISQFAIMMIAYQSNIRTDWRAADANALAAES